MGSLYLGGPTIQEVDGKMMGLSIYGVAAISGSLYSRFYGVYMSGLLCLGPEDADQGTGVQVLVTERMGKLL